MARTVIFCASLLLASASSMVAAKAPGPDIRISDVDRFFRIYDSAAGRPDGGVLQREYIDAGTAGVREFVPYRIKSGDNLAQQIAKAPDVYRQARACLTALPAVKRELAHVFAKLARLYPEAKFPPVTILIGGNNSGGTTGPTGVLIGLEVVCSSLEPGQTIQDRLIHTIAHEYAHVEQAPMSRNTLLAAVMPEGVAELVAELTSGQISNPQLIPWTKGRETAIGQAFLAEKDRPDRNGAWLYNGKGTPERPGDLGYWIGWRIAKSYYAHARDKRAAMRALLALTDPNAILVASGWQPGD